MLFVKGIGQIFSMPFFPSLDASPPQTYHNHITKGGRNNTWLCHALCLSVLVLYYYGGKECLLRA